MEKRRTKRVDSVNPATIEFPDEANPLAGNCPLRTLNISGDGAAIEISSLAPVSIPVGWKLLLAITLGEITIAAHGRVAHEKRVSERQVTVGVQFTEILPNARQAIADFLRQ